MMCSEVILPDDTLCTTQRVLRKYLGDENVVYCEGYPHPDEMIDSCLCPVDLDATAKKIGCTADYKRDPFYVYFVENKRP